MTQYSETDRTLALGGVFQAARIARDVARNGMSDAEAFSASRESLFAFEPESVEDVFGGRDALAQGLRILLKQLEGTMKRDLEISRYVVSMLHLADRLMSDKAGMQGLYEDLSALDRRRGHFELNNLVVHEQLDDIYQNRISALGPRIMVRGEPLHLQNPENVSKVRVALLAGIRAAVLWRQAGGKKWKLLLMRKTISATARDLVDNIR